MKIFKCFRKWKEMVKIVMEEEVNQEEKIIRSEIKVKYNVFAEWKRTAIGEKRAALFYRNKIYRTFIMQCTSMLHLRLKTIYCE